MTKQATQKNLINLTNLSDIPTICSDILIGDFKSRGNNIQ